MSQYEPLINRYPPASIPEIVAHIQKYLVKNGVIPGVASVCGVVPDDQQNIPLKGSNIPLQPMSVQTVAQAIEEILLSLSNLDDQIDDEETSRTNADTALSTRIGTLEERHNILFVGKNYTPTSGVFDIVCSTINASTIISVTPIVADVGIEKMIISSLDPLTYRVTLSDTTISTPVGFQIVYIGG